MELKNVEIISIEKLKTFDSGFSCVEWVVKEQEGQYPQFLKLQSNKDKAENVIKYQKVGDMVDVSINLQGRQWTNPEGEVKTFNTIEAWKVFKADLSDDKAKKAVGVIDSVFEPLEPSKSSVANNAPVQDEEDDILPF